MLRAFAPMFHYMTCSFYHLPATLLLLGAASVLAADFVQPTDLSTGTINNMQIPALGHDKWGYPLYHPMVRTRLVRTTAYTHSESDHLRYGALSAAGTTLQYTDTLRSAAADWSVYPLGTKFRIKGQPYTYIVDDYGGALVGTGTIDIYHPTKKLMRAWGTRQVEIEIIEWGSAERSLRLLAGRRGSRHCKNMYTALVARNPQG